MAIRHSITLGVLSGNGTTSIFDLGDLKQEWELLVAHDAGVTAYSVQLQVSMDGVNFVTALTPVTNASPAPVSSKAMLARWVRAVLTAYAGAGNVTVELGYGAGI